MLELCMGNERDSYKLYLSYLKQMFDANKANNKHPLLMNKVCCG
jgi:hypothetical protein